MSQKTTTKTLQRKPRREKYPDWKINIKDCKIEFAIIPSGKRDPGYGVVFMNVTFPDGRWIPFRSVEDARISIYRDKPEESR